MIVIVWPYAMLPAKVTVAVALFCSSSGEPSRFGSPGSVLDALKYVLLITGLFVANPSPSIFEDP